MTGPTTGPGPFGRAGARLRQRLQPAEFRIEEGVWPAGMGELLQRIGELKDQQQTLKDQIQTLPPGASDDNLIATTMGVWRLQRRIEAAGTELGGRAKQMRRPLKIIWDGLADLGIETQDHEGKPFDDGLALEAIAIQPEPGLTCDTIIETVQPSIYRDGRMIQMGHVIVGRPERPADS